ncbi:hypothetical protein K440DRAFT_621542 [Wilcoxina mikolae CBS 423.85]|nr:hypothetical protein K440DRAFT_621542 [Wilcoxina mikolae CBS 423.85]
MVKLGLQMHLLSTTFDAATSSPWLNHKALNLSAQTSGRIMCHLPVITGVVDIPESWAKKNTHIRFSRYSSIIITIFHSIDFATAREMECT